MANAQQAAQWARANPNQLIAAGVAAVVIAASGWVGLKARAANAELSAKRAAWETAAGQLATVQQQFRVPTSTESASLVAEASRMGALGVPKDDKLGLVDLIGRLAEACNLGSVRVSSIASPDSMHVPERQVAGTTVRTADYALAVEFVGSFANAQKFVSSLPPSVSVSRLGASRRSGGTQYQLVLSVYELDGQPGN